MQLRVKPEILIVLSAGGILAVASVFVARAVVPVTGNPWFAVICFAAFATLAELLTVDMGEESNVGVTPSSPIYWAATCVLGPIPAVVACVAAALSADVIAVISYHLALKLEPRVLADEAVSGEGRTRLSRWARPVVGALKRAGTIWECRKDEDLVAALRTTGQYVSALVLLVAPAGLVYHFLGGRFLTDTGRDFHVFRHLVLPFLGLVFVAIVIEHLNNMVLAAVIDPIRGVKGWYGILLKLKLVLIETTLPVCRAQLFLVVVALLMSYLYAYIGVLGIVVTIMPVVALRDFFYNWVAEKSAYVDTITTLATYMQLYHPYTRGHLKRVADMSVRLARELRLPADSIRHISYAGFLHDIGKIGVSEEILDKASKLTDEEWGKIKEHPVKGAEIISHLEFLEGIVDWIKYHHKWYDGSGYPNGTDSATNVPIEASIIAVADSFDAMTDDRELTVEWKCDSCGYVPDNDDRPQDCPRCKAPKRRYYREPKTKRRLRCRLRKGL